MICYAIGVNSVEKALVKDGILSQKNEVYLQYFIPFHYNLLFNWEKKGCKGFSLR